MPRFLVVFDADSTLLRNEVIELIADEAGRGPEVAAATEAAMRGAADFATSLRSRVAMLAGVELTAFDSVVSRVEPQEGAADLVRAIHERDGLAMVVSGGFHEVLDRVAPSIGVDQWRANRLEHDGTHLTGAVSGAIVDAAAKRSALLEWAAEAGIDPRLTVAVGDGANDLMMIHEAGLGIAFNAKPAVRASAAVVIGDVDLREIIPLLP